MYYFMFSQIKVSDAISILSSIVIAAFAAVSGMVIWKNFKMRKLSTSCRNFLGINLQQWLKDLNEIKIKLKDKHFSEILFIDERKEKMYLRYGSGQRYFPKLLKRVPPELIKAAPIRLRRIFKTLDNEVNLFNRNLSLLSKKVENLGNECYKLVKNIGYSKIPNLEKYVVAWMVLDGLTLESELLNSYYKSSTISELRGFFRTEEARNLISKTKEKLCDERTEVLKLSEDVLKEAEELEALLQRKKQELSVKYYIPLREFR